jgi:hypothetical protein
MPGTGIAELEIAPVSDSSPSEVGESSSSVGFEFMEERQVMCILVWHLTWVAIPNST